MINRRFNACITHAVFVIELLILIGPHFLIKFCTKFESGLEFNRLLIHSVMSLPLIDKNKVVKTREDGDPSSR